jgi:hypothetical protein
MSHARSSRVLAFNVLPHLYRLVRRLPIHDEQRWFLYVLCQMVDGFFHNCRRHALHWLFMRRATSSAAPASILVGMKDKEGWYVDAISAHCQHQGVAKGVASFMHNCIRPKQILGLGKMQKTQSRGGEVMGKRDKAGMTLIGLMPEKP